MGTLSLRTLKVWGGQGEDERLREGRCGGSRGWQPGRVQVELRDMVWRGGDCGSWQNDPHHVLARQALLGNQER